MEWTYEPTAGWVERWVCRFVAPDGRYVSVRIMREHEEQPWHARWTDIEAFTEIPRHLTFEEAKAYALALWRLS